MSPAKHFKGRRLFGAEELALLHRALINQNLFGVDGKMVAAFEQNFAQAYGVPYAVASTSGTAAIETALGAVRINPGDEVITAPITDLGSIIPIINQGGIPVFADVDETYNMDPKEVEKKITPRTKAIIAVHLFGNPCDMDAFVSIAQKHKLVLIEDCSQAHVTEYKGRYVGTIGDFGCYSFQQSKHMTTGDGGMTITRNKQYYDYMKLFVDKGFARKGWGARAYMFHAPNYRMNELTAAVGLAQLKKVKEVVRKRRELGEYMTKLLSGINGIRPRPETGGGVHSYWLYPVYFEGKDVDAFAAEMKKNKVRASIGYTVKPIYLCAESLTVHKTYGNSQYPFSWKDVDKPYEYKEGLCPKAEAILKRLVCVNLNECWTREQVEQTAEGLKASCLTVEGTAAGTGKTTSVAVERTAAKVTSSAQKKIRIGIVGCGTMGNMHLTALKTCLEVEIAGCADTDIEKARQCAQRVHANAYASHKELLAHERLDGLCVCTVPSAHREIVLDALDKGVHVLCEKPLAVSTREAEEMTVKARQVNKLLLTAFKFRFFEEVRQAKALIDQGSLGQITHFRVMFGGYLDMAGTWYANKAISGGGIVMDNGPHAIDLIRYLLGEIKNIEGHFSRIQPIGVEDTALLNIELVNGAKGTVDISWSTPVPASHYFEIYGTEGTALLGLKDFTYKFKTWADFKNVPNQRAPKEAFAQQFGHFVQAMKTGKTTQTNNDDGLMTQRLIERVYSSCEVKTV